jgi:hypothetical protein
MGTDEREHVPQEGTNGAQNLRNKQSYSWFSGLSLTFTKHRGMSSMKLDIQCKTSTHSLAVPSNRHPKDVNRFNILQSSCSPATKKIIHLPQIHIVVSWNAKWHHNDCYISFFQNARPTENSAIILSHIITIMICPVYSIHATDWTLWDRVGSGSTDINGRHRILNLPGVQVTDNRAPNRVHDTIYIGVFLVFGQHPMGLRSQNHLFHILGRCCLLSLVLPCLWTDCTTLPYNHFTSLAPRLVSLRRRWFNVRWAELRSTTSYSWWTGLDISGVSAFLWTLSFLSQLSWSSRSAVYTSTEWHLTPFSRSGHINESVSRFGRFSGMDGIHS